MESNSFGILAEGTLLLKEEGWCLVTEAGEAFPVNDMLQKWDGRKVRVVIANMEILASVAPGDEMKFANSMSNEEISQRLRRR